MLRCHPFRQLLVAWHPYQPSCLAVATARWISQVQVKLRAVLWLPVGRQRGLGRQPVRLQPHSAAARWHHLRKAPELVPELVPELQLQWHFRQLLLVLEWQRAEHLEQHLLPVLRRWMQLYCSDRLPELVMLQEPPLLVLLQQAHRHLV